MLLSEAYQFEALGELIRSFFFVTICDQLCTIAYNDIQLICQVFVGGGVSIEKHSPSSVVALVLVRALYYSSFDQQFCAGKQQQPSRCIG